jgi:hypothetical protein
MMAKKKLIVVDEDNLSPFKEEPNIQKIVNNAFDNQKAKDEEIKRISPEMDKLINDTIKQRDHLLDEPKKSNIWGELSKDRYKVWGKYKFDRWMFQIFLSIFLIGVFWIAKSNDYELDYFACIDPPSELPLWNLNPTQGYDIKIGMCHNPFYKPADWKNTEYLTAGEYGVPPGKIIKPLIWSVVLGFLLTVALNHIIHNRGRKNGEDVSSNRTN